MGNSCAFFGHRSFSYDKYEGTVKNIIVELIEKYHVTQFYSGGRGAFDRFSARVVSELKKEYPQIIMTQVLSYIPGKKDEFDLKPLYYDDSVYLLERQVPPQYAILETNKLLADKADFIVSGVHHSWGGAAKAVEYAEKHRKLVISIFEPQMDSNWFRTRALPFTYKTNPALVQRAIEKLNERNKRKS